MKTFHEYVTPCSKALYDEYGQIEGTLLMQGIQSLGVHFKDGFRGNDGKIYHHMLLVMSPHPIENLTELFPGVTTPWTHKENQHDEKHMARVGPYTTSMRHGNLHIDAKDVTFRA